MKTYNDLFGVHSKLPVTFLFGEPETHFHKENPNLGFNRIIGDDFDNLLQGTSGTDLIFGLGGNDTLDGGNGADMLYGGSGNDIYYIGSSSDMVMDSEGYDWVFTTTSYDLPEGCGIDVLDTLDENSTTPIDLFGTNDFEFLLGNNGSNILIGYGGDDPLYGYGGSDRLEGGDGNDSLIGGSGADVMLGGLGDDYYLVDNINDVVKEAANSGHDNIAVGFSFSLIGTNIEDITANTGFFVPQLTGNEAANVMYGNSGANKLIGNEGDDDLQGWEGADTLIGGSGNDILGGWLGIDTLTGGEGYDNFQFAGYLTHGDIIKDFSQTEDRFFFDSIFSGIAQGELESRHFVLGKAALDQDDRVIYDQQTGRLYADKDGLGGTSQILIAVLENHAAMSARDIFIVGD